MNKSSHKVWRGVLLTWLLLMALLLASAGSAYLPLGGFNAVLGLGIAAVKTGLVAWRFMRLREAVALIRATALLGLWTLGLLAVLSGVDFSTRAEAPAPVQPPQQLAP